MSNFDTAIQKVLMHEGGYVNHPKDPGGATNYGISLRFLKTLRGYEFATESTIRNLNLDEAIAIYKKEFWEKGQYYKIEDETIAAKIFDMTVNMGASRAHKIAQRAVRAATGESLIEDGILGEKSFSAINRANEVALLAAIRSEAASFYRSLNKPEFINGWLNRAYS